MGYDRDAVYESVIEVVQKGRWSKTISAEKQTEVRVKGGGSSTLRELIVD